MRWESCSRIIPIRCMRQERIVRSLQARERPASFVASDVPAILHHTRTVYFIENEEIVQLTADALHFYNIDGEEIEKESTEITWDLEAAEKGGYDHFLLKEIYEQPKAVADTLNPTHQGQRDRH